MAKRIAQAQASYKEALAKASDSPALAAMAQLGLGLCEEELGNFDAAVEVYRKLKDNSEYDGTTAQATAAYRLETMDDYKTAVVFKPAPAPKPIPGQGASSPAIQIGPSDTPGPIQIELPETVTPGDEHAGPGCTGRHRYTHDRRDPERAGPGRDARGEPAGR